MKLDQTDYDNAETGCCARLDVDRWDGREWTWTEQPFLKDRIRSFLRFPLNFGTVMTRGHAAVEAAEAYPREPLWLSDESSPWGSNLFMATDRDVPAADMARLSGRFTAKVFEGPYRDAGKWLKSMQDHLQKTGREAKKTYFWYATCPKCAKTFGKNHVALISELA